MGYVYLNREIRGGYIELSEALDSNYAQGTTYDEYRTGNPAPWIPLSEAQLSFRDQNPGVYLPWRFSTGTTTRKTTLPTSA